MQRRELRGLFRLTILALAAFMAACGGPGEDMAMNTWEDVELEGAWRRAGERDCHGELPLEYLPLDQEFIHTDDLRIEEHDGNIAFIVGDGVLFYGVLDTNTGEFIFAEQYGIVVDYIPEMVPPEQLYYYEAMVYREAYLYDAETLVFEDTYTSRGEELSCRHVFQLP